MQLFEGPVFWTATCSKFRRSGPSSKWDVPGIWKLKNPKFEVIRRPSCSKVHFFKIANSERSKKLDVKWRFFTYGYHNTLDTLRIDILTFCDESTPTIFVGDFNSRTGNIPNKLRNWPLFGWRRLRTNWIPSSWKLTRLLIHRAKILLILLLEKPMNIERTYIWGPLGNFTTFKNGHNSLTGNIPDKLINWP